tara:strand:+ start:273 stop:587 length:315 start_codon:yes stop_codon:yes gene_type:complete
MNKALRVLLFYVMTFLPLDVYCFDSDHEKAIEAVKDGQILPLDQILSSLQNKFEGRVLAINLKDSEKGLFGWVYDIRMIDKRNKIINLRVDAGTSTILFTESGD